MFLFLHRKSDPQQLIPLPIKKSIMYINEHGNVNIFIIFQMQNYVTFRWKTALDEEGIYRVSAGVAKIKRIRHEFDSGW